MFCGHRIKSILHDSIVQQGLGRANGNIVSTTLVISTIFGMEVFTYYIMIWNLVPFVIPKFCPPENIYTKVYGEGIKGKTLLSTVKVIFVATFTGFCNQDIAKFFDDTIISVPACLPRLVRVTVGPSL